MKRTYRLFMRGGREEIADRIKHDLNGQNFSLNVTAEKDGYTLADRGTYLALNKKKRLPSVILVEGEPGLSTSIMSWRLTRPNGPRLMLPARSLL
jgi:ABC-type tungstate transport system permease subunit